VGAKLVEERVGLGGMARRDRQHHGDRELLDALGEVDEKA
jgi:hypothetical protein